LSEPGRSSQDSARELARVRAWATGILLVLAAVFVATHFLGGDEPWVRLVRAMAEAGMVGGLADWFAVEALFRRPLGLPIPHTALLSRNQARAARNVGRFFETHFLEPSALEARVRRIEPARRLSAWMAQPQNAELVARQLVALAGNALAAEPSPRALARGRAWLRTQVSEAGPEADAALAAGIARLVKDGVRSPLVDEVIGLLRRTVEDGRDTAASLVRDRSRWWIHSSIDRRMAGMAVEGVLSLLDELQSGQSDLRDRFEAAFDDVVDRLLAEGTLARGVGDARRHMASTGALDELTGRIAVAVRARLSDRIAADPDAVAEPVTVFLAGLAGGIARDPAASERLDERLAGLAGHVVGVFRPQLGGYVAEVIAGWKPDELIARFETELGPDLQFIRINGAVLGALIGGVLFGLGVILG
jgi:uncharacterized membrane-anchored protein YjiN (DUF445 family)